MQRPTNGSPANGSPARAPVRKLADETLIPIAPDSGPTIGQKAQSVDNAVGKWVRNLFDLTPPPSNGLLDRALDSAPVKKPAIGTPKTPNVPQHPVTILPIATKTNGRVSPPKYLSNTSSPNISPKHMNGHAVNGDAKHANGLIVDDAKAKKLILEKIQLIQNNVQGSFDPLKQLINVVMENVKTILHIKDKSAGIENLTTYLETILALDASSENSVAEVKQAIERIQFKFPHEYRKDQLLQEIKSMLTASHDDDQTVSLLQRFERELGSYTRPVLTSIKAKEDKAEFPNNFDFMMYLFKIHFGQAYEDAIAISKSIGLSKQNRVLKAELRKKITKEQQKTREIDFFSTGFTAQPIQGQAQASDEQKDPPKPAEPNNATLDFLSPADLLQKSLSFKAEQKTSTEPDKKEMTLPIQTLIWELIGCHSKFMEKIIALKDNHIFTFLKDIDKLENLTTPSYLDARLFDLKKQTTVNPQAEDLIRTLFKLKNLQLKINKVSELDNSIEMTLPHYQLLNYCSAEELKKFNDTQHVKAFNGWIDEAAKAIDESDQIAELTIMHKKKEEERALAAQEAEHRKNAEFIEEAKDFAPKTPVNSGMKPSSRRPSAVEETKEAKKAEPDSPSSNGEPAKDKPKVVTFSDEGDHIVGEGSEDPEEEDLLHPERSSTSSTSPSARNASMIANRGSSVNDVKENDPTPSKTADYRWTKRLGVGGMFLGAGLATALLLIPGVNLVTALGIAVWGIVAICTAGGALFGCGIGCGIDKKCLPCCGSQKTHRKARSDERRDTIRRNEERRTNSTKIFDYVGNPSASIPINTDDRQNNNTVYTQENPPPTVSTYTPPAHSRVLRKDSRSPSPR